MYYTVHDVEDVLVYEGIIEDCDIFDLDSIREAIDEILQDYGFPVERLFLASLYHDGTDEFPFAIITVKTT
jgi:hypothetical protein